MLKLVDYPYALAFGEFSPQQEFEDTKQNGYLLDAYNTACQRAIRYSNQALTSDQTGEAEFLVEQKAKALHWNTVAKTLCVVITHIEPGSELSLEEMLPDPWED